MIQFIKNEIVTTSSHVEEFISQRDDVTNEAARKRIQRLPKECIKIPAICSDRKSIIYYQGNDKNEEYKAKLILLLKEEAKQHFYIYSSLKDNGGCMHHDELASLSASPVENVKSRKRYDEVVKDLISKLKLITKDEDNMLYCYDYEKSDFKTAKASRIASKIVLADFNDWARKIGLISYDSTYFNGKFSNYQFSLTAPSYIETLAIKGKNKITPAFVVADIALDNNFSDNYVDCFIAKISNIAHSHQKAKMLPFFITASHNKETHQKLKEKGIIIGNTNVIFGKDYTEAIFDIKNLLINVNTILSKNPNQIDKLLNKIQQLSEGKANNLRGSFFEVLIGYFYSNFCQSVEVSKIITFEENQREIDVVAILHDKVIICEAKAYKQEVSLDIVKKWRKDKISIIYQWIKYREDLRDKEIVIEFWATGGFTQESLDYLSNCKRNTNKYELNYYNLEAMKKISKEKKVRVLNRILEEHFTNELQKMANSTPKR